MTPPDPNLALAEGDLDGLVAAFEAAEPGGDDDRARWALRFLEVGDVARAAAIAAQILDPARAAEMVELLGEPPGSEDEEEAISLPPRDDAPDAEGKLPDLFLRWFGGRRDLYARQWYSEGRQRGGYRPVREPLTEEVARAHLRGQLTVGQYLLDRHGKVHFAVIDLDVSADALAALEATDGGPQGLQKGRLDPLAHPPLQKYLRALLLAGRRLGVPLWPAASGGRGAHLWLFFDHPRPASSVRSLLGQITTLAGAPPPSLELELFPKQDLPGPRGLSSLVKLPLGRHQRTLNPCPLLDDQLAPISDPVKALERLESVPGPVFDALVGRRVVPLPAPEGVPVPPLPPLPTDGGPQTLAQILRRIPPGVDEKKAADQVLDRCAILRHLMSEAYHRRTLSAGQARAITYSLGLLGKSPETAKQALIAAGVSLKELARVGKGTSPPVGCKRLRALVPSIPCAGCPIGPDAIPYATPLIAVAGPVPVAPPRHRRFSSYLNADERVVQTADEKVFETLSRIERRLDAIEAKSGRQKASGPSRPKSASQNDCGPTPGPLEAPESSEEE